MRHAVRVMTGLALSGAVLVGFAGGVQAQAPASASAAKAKELVTLMKGKKLEAFAMRESVFESRFVATLVTPDVETLLVSALYSRPSDIDYYIYNKDYNRAYGDLVSGQLASDRFLVEDILGDGLMAVPGKNGVSDAVTTAGAKQLFEGPADPKKHNDKRMPAEEYGKKFDLADKHYAALLDTLIQELKKPPTP
jgi:hypothetical protein